MPISLFSKDKLEKYKTRIVRIGTFRKKPYCKNLSVNIPSLSESLLNGHYEFGEFHKEGKMKPFYQCQSLQDEIVMQSLNKVIRGAYKVRQADRNLMVKQVVSLLNENHEKYIYRLDISKFYESISLHKSIMKLIKDGLLSAEYEEALWSLYNALNYQIERVNGIKGLPRGLSISATLSEIFMRSFDESVRMIDGVYFYGRFVDDIVIFSSQPLNINEQLKTKLPEGLNLNYEKNRWFKVHPKKCKKRCSCKHSPHRLDFLGYGFNFPKYSCRKMPESNLVQIGLSSDKFMRAKKRLHDSFWYYRTKGRPKSLINRVKFLTSNYIVDKNKSDSSDLYSGVFYSYQRINDLSQLAELDKLLHYYLKLSPEYGRFLVNDDIRLELSNCSFVKGFLSKKINKFTPSEISSIKGIWNVK